MSTYDKYSNFILTDPRISRPTRYSGYNVNPEFMQGRHDAFFHNYDLKDKRILDIGCCVGALGAYALDHGAKFYCGVEYNKILSDISISNFSSSFPDNVWEIKNISVEDFSKSNNEKYDILILSGVIYALFDPIPVLIALHNMADSIIVESMQPTIIELFPIELKQIIIRNAKWSSFLENSSFVQYGDTPMMTGYPGGSAVVNGCAPSLGFIKHFLNLLGFKNTNIVNDLLKDKFPDVYNTTGRYGERFEKYTDSRKALGYVEI